MIGELKPNLTLDKIEQLLQGSDDQEGIRFIDVNYYSNEALLFIRKKDNKEVLVKREPFRPFVWFKGFDFTKDFSWQYLSCPSKNFDPYEKVAMIKNQIYHLSDKFEIIGQSPNGNEYFFRSYIESIQDRKKLCYEKMKEYNIDIKETITTFDPNKKVKRLENGFKFLVHINSQEEKHYSNPSLAYTAKGFAKKITGTFANLIDFFAEGGINLWKKSGVFLSKEKFDSFWKTATPQTKMLFFLSIPFKETVFYVVDEKEISSSIIGDDESQYTEVNFQGLSEWIKVKTTQTVKPHKIFEFFLNKIHNDGYQFIFDNFKELNSFIKLSPNQHLIEYTLENDYSFDSRKTFKALNTFLINRGIDIFFGEERLFFNLSPLEQYMSQSGKRLFKGIENYSELRIMTMDIETKGLDGEMDKNAALSPYKGRIFKIGILCNNGVEIVLNAKNDEEERQIIREFFQILCDNDPDLFITYNGEGFDWPFIITRWQLLNNFKDEDETYANIRAMFSSYYEKFEGYLNKKNFFIRHSGNLKIGGSSEKYMQTNILGMNLCDTMFAVKRAAAINKSIPNNKLKDNIKHAGLAKPNRVYVPGDKIGETENSDADFYLNESDGDWVKFKKEIVFYDNPYLESKIYKKGAATFIYENENTLYLWDKNCNDPQLMATCSNTMEFDSFNDNVENYIETFFVDLYGKVKKYDSVCFQKKTYIGYYLKDQLLGNLKNKLGSLRTNISKKEIFFPEKDFSQYIKVDGREIVKRYLIDDLWETVKLDEFYSQATFLISKWLPTSYQRAATMGGASVWKLILSMYSYQYGLAIPEFDEPRDFSGGLVAMFSCGFHGVSFKGDYGALYPCIYYEHIQSSPIDLLKVKKLFTYFGWKTRNTYKELMNQSFEKGDIVLGKEYETKQLPIKILNNSFFGANGAAAVTPFADLMEAQGTTCIGRQWLRNLIKWFNERGFYATIAHTDGVFFAFNKADLTYEYVGKGKNWKVEKDKVYTGVAAYVAEYNDTFMKGIMCLDIDEVVESVLNFAKGNYFYLKQKKQKDGTKKDVVEIIGGAIIKKSQSEFISDFVQKEVMTLMKNKPLGFLEAYWKYIGEIFDRKIAIKKIATKAKNKKSKQEYLEHIKGKNKNGAPLNKQAHMELLINNNIDFEVGDFTYYVNTGLSKNDSDSKSINIPFCSFELDRSLSLVEDLFKSENREKIKQLILKLHENGTLIPNARYLDGDLNDFLSDIKSWKNIKMKTKGLKKGVFIEIIKVDYVLNCSLVDLNNEDHSVEYNRDLYIHKFNSAVKPLFICFKPEIRSRIMINNPQDRPFILEEELQLINGIPFEGHEKDQTSLKDAMQLSNEESEYWENVELSPESYNTTYK